MIWLEIMTLDDGRRIESSLPSQQEAAAGGQSESYRVHHPDGTTHYFTSMTETLHHLRHGSGVDGVRPRFPELLDRSTGGTGPRAWTRGPSDSGGR
jgi:hypothetical protein